MTTFKTTAPLLVALACLFAADRHAFAETILYESGDLGQTSVTPEEVFSQAVPGSNIGSDVFVGARFHLKGQVITSSVGGHFVASPTTGGSFFGAIVRLTDANDFPDSKDLESTDVLGATALSFPATSEEVFGDLRVALDPGDYALVFGSGLFGTTGIGAVLRNNSAAEQSSFIAFSRSSGVFSEPLNPAFSDFYFSVRGIAVPAPPATALISALGWFSFCGIRFRTNAFFLVN